MHTMPSSGKSNTYTDVKGVVGNDHDRPNIDGTDALNGNRQFHDRFAERSELVSTLRVRLS